MTSADGNGRKFQAVQGERLSKVIADDIMKQISDGRLIAGQQLPSERDMARQYQASRVSLREAYRWLEDQGLLRIRRGVGGGAFVMLPDHHLVRRSLLLLLTLNGTSHLELTEARSLIEPIIARLAARRAQPADIARLEDVLLQEEQAAYRRGEPFRPTQSQFHRIVAQCAGNFPMTVLMNTLADLTVEVASTIAVAARRQHQRKNCHYHRRLFDAIRRHDEDEAYAIMLRHINDIQGRVHRTIRRQWAADARIGDGVPSSGRSVAEEDQGLVAASAPDSASKRRKSSGAA